MSGISTIATTAASITLTTGAELVLQPGTNQVLTDLKGWHNAPGMRRNTTPRLWSHGNFSERGWRDARLISVQGFIFCDNRADAAAMTDTLNAALADGTEGTFTVNDSDLGHRWAKVYMVGTPTIDWNGNDYIYFAVDMEAPDPRKYGLLSTAATAVAAPGGGLAWDLFSTDGYSYNSGVNLATNPQPYTATGWATTSAYVKSYDTNRLGRNAMLYTKSGASYWLVRGYRAGLMGTAQTAGPSVPEDVVAVTPGQTLNIRMDISTDNTNTDGRIGIRWFTAAYASISLVESAVVPMQMGVWQEFSFSAVAPANAAYAWIEWGVAMISGNTVGGEKVWASDVYIGTTAPAPRAGTAGVLDFGAAGASGTVTFTNPGTADTAPVLKVTGYAPGFTITNVATGARLIYTDTILAGQYVLLSASDGSVLLNGYADRSGALSRREWSMIPGNGSATFLFESPGAVGAELTLEAYPAWW